MSKDEMIEYLEQHNWEHYPGTGYEDEAMLLPGRIQFEGDDAVERAFTWQLREEQQTE